MSDSIGILDQKSSRNIDKTNVYSDLDGTFDCTLIKVMIICFKFSKKC